MSCSNNEYGEIKSIIYIPDYSSIMIKKIRIHKYMLFFKSVGFDNAQEFAENYVLGR